MPFTLPTVALVTSNDGKGNTTSTGYSFQIPLYDYEDREFRGFMAADKWLPDRTLIKTLYHQDDILKGHPYQEFTFNASDWMDYKMIQRTFKYREVVAGSIYSPYLDSETTTLYNEASNTYDTKVSYEYDNYGNTRRKYSFGNTGLSGDERDERVDYAAYYDTTRWLLSRPAATYTRDAANRDLARTTYEYKPQTNLVTRKTLWLDKKQTGETDPVIDYTYDFVSATDPCTAPDVSNNGSVGNLRTITDPKGNNTLKILCYDSTRTYPTKLQNALGHLVARKYNNFGKLIEESDPNGNTTIYEYDAFGRITKMANPIDLEMGSTYGTTQRSYVNFGKADPHIATYQTETSGTSKHLYKRVYLDGLGREIKTESEGPLIDGSVRDIVAETQYDYMGRVARKSLPYYKGLDAPKWTLYAYDALGRVEKTTYPDLSFSRVEYDRNMTAFIDPLGRKQVQVSNGYGQIEQVKDYSGTTDAGHSLYATTRYGYDAVGRLYEITDAGGNLITIEYDSLSRRTKMIHPDMGTWAFGYDPNGNLTSQLDTETTG